MLNNRFSFLARRNSLALIIVALISTVILLSSFMIRNGQFTFLNRASSSWTVAALPPACNGTWQLDTSKTHNGIDVSESYNVTFPSAKNVILFDWDNDPKGSGSSKEIGHIFKINGVEYKVPEQVPAKDQQWSTISLSNVTKIEYSRNEDSGGSNVCILGTATTPTKSPTPTVPKSPTPKPSVTTGATPTKAPSPSLTKSPTATPVKSPTPVPSGQVCKLDADIVLVIDRSSSMNSKETDGRTKLEWAKEAATNLVARIAATSGVNAKVGIVSFGAQGNDGKGTKDAKYNSTMHIAPSADFNAVKTAIANVKYIESGTCIECGLRIANDQLTSTTRNRVVILLSDGKANHNWEGSSSDATARTITAANNGRSKGIVYYVLGYGTSVDSDTLTSIAGSASRYRYKPDAKDWPTAFLSILDQVCSELPTPTLSPTKSPTPTNTPQPTNSPTKTPSPSPTKSPTPTNTPQPTDQPSHTPTPTVPACIIPAVQNVRITCPICN
ncbi:VWA domain-containing protein [Candidatus Woesebacteria bacterium]|nr:VWA domain-containing protein [Candidatus Woesebacteria bacterium]